MGDHPGRTSDRRVADRRRSVREADVLRAAAITALRHEDIPTAQELVRQADLLDPPRPDTVNLDEEQVCDSCDRPFADDAEMFDCPNANGPLHLACHAARGCRSRDCAEALADR